MQGPEPTDGVTKMAMLQFHWNNYHLRQSHFWRSFNQLILAIVTLWAIPFVRPSLFNISVLVYFFPIVSILLSVVGKDLLKAEYKRLNALIHIIDIHTSEDYKPKFEKHKCEPGEIGILVMRICWGIIGLSIIDLIAVALIRAYHLMPNG